MAWELSYSKWHGTQGVEHMAHLADHSNHVAHAASKFYSQVEHNDFIKKVMKNYNMLYLKYAILLIIIRVIYSPVVHGGL